MDVERFDLLTRLLATNTSRRLALVGLTVPSLRVFGSAEVDAKRRKKRKKKRRKKPTCPDGQKRCNGACIELDACCSDTDCGESVCDDGECVCPAGARFCRASDTCIPNDECCGCASNQRCCQVDGVPRCIVLSSDPDHCGACNSPCASGVCINKGCAEPCEEDADCAPDECFRRVGFNQRVCAFTASLPRFCDSVETCAGGSDAACAGDIKEACLEDICGLAQGCGRIAV